MTRFALRRLLMMLPMVLIVLTITFIMVQMAPGSPFSSQRRLPPEIEANLKAKYGFDQPKLTQYWRYMGRLMRFHLQSRGEKLDLASLPRLRRFHQVQR